LALSVIKLIENLHEKSSVLCIKVLVWTLSSCRCRIGSGSSNVAHLRVFHWQTAIHQRESLDLRIKSTRHVALWGGSLEHGCQYFRYLIVYVNSQASLKEAMEILDNWKTGFLQRK